MRDTAHSDRRRVSLAEAPLLYGLSPCYSEKVMRTFEEVAKIISPVYLVGGSVRDQLLGIEPKDYDFTTPLPPDEIEARVRRAGKRAYVAGRRFGTIGFKLGETSVEVTTFRSESYMPGSRKPRVEFVDDITYDLSRRDFTINAMALRRDGSLIDPFGGKQDLQRKVLRTVGKPQDRFKEDPLRMLRAARFVSQLGFTVDTATELRVLKHADKILDVSRERWVQELDRLLEGEHVAEGLEFLARTRLIVFMIPELSIQVGYDQDSPYHELDLWHHSVKTVELTPRHVVQRWGALLHDIGKPYVRVKNRRGYSNYMLHEVVGAELVKKIGRYLGWSNERTHDVTEIVREHLHNHSPIGIADDAARFKSD